MISDSATDRPRAARAASPRASAFRSNLNLTRELAVTTFKLKYTGSVLGYAWSLVKPLLIFGMTYLVFAVLLLRGRTKPGENFPVELLLGIVIWTFFADATVSAVGAIVGNAHIVAQGVLPALDPGGRIDAQRHHDPGVNLALMLAIGLPLGWFHIGLSTLLLPLLFIELYMLVAGVGLLMSALFVFYRDLGHVWEITLQLLFYASAIVFPFSIIPRRFRQLLAFNPMGQLIEDMRRALVTSVVPWSSDILGGLLVVPLAAVCVLLAVGFLVFHKLTPKFGEAL